MNKDIFRKMAIKTLKRSSTQPNKYAKDKKIQNHLLKIIKKHKPQNILLYIPLSLEVNISPLILKLKKTNMNIFVPFMQNLSFKPVKYRRPLKVKKFDIYEPPYSCKKIKNIDLVVVPVVGVDGIMKRVGFGAGMYDRFFASLKYKPTTIFVQRTPCITNAIVTDHFDIQADYYVVPKGIMKIS